MNDLTICQKIAEIEGVTNTMVAYPNQEKSFLGLVDTHDFSGTPPELIGEYNPLKCGALLLDLIFKHEVEIGFDSESIGMKSASGEKWVGADYDGKDNLPRAILELIIEAHKC